MQKSMAFGLNELVERVPPPEPVWYSTKDAGARRPPDFTQGQLPPSGLPGLPTDYWEFIRRYGSVSFSLTGYGYGDIIRVLSPFDPRFPDWLNDELTFFREYRASEGPEYFSEPIYPEPCGLFPWGEGIQRKHYFWRTTGEPDRWTVVAYYDLEIFTSFELSMSQFLAQLMLGKIDARFIGYPRPEFRFEPRHWSVDHF